ncbi:TonB-dependent receptor plug domain-containing protein [Sphingomonas sp. AR_OL41]|uniref:TonB-dependent receptor plug domain-containing protein n=1 Tax=Sphingomonas sp. AR_OL41 TaxID=3042729 RepID=UPI002480D1C8|nr:TonB-dependent receptor plug domain-containing protein [Sphingomonas sp. AR_OL41]MDH7975224.1 TonB-dependent receptor plug domain-containing protein [Sphingomonas sp. AR_OL41]
MLPSVVHAERPVAIDLPPGQLGRALVLLSRQTDEDIGTGDPTLPLRTTPAVHGNLTIRQALDRLLATSGAVAIRTGPRSWRIALRSPLQRSRPPVPPKASEAPVADIVVTGTKRPVALALYPGTAAILDLDGTGRAAAPAGTATIENRLSSIASTHFGSGRDKIFIRGIADSGFTGPNQATTGQYFNDTRLTYNAPDPDLRLYDVARVEILEGPQGALYGAGSLGGVIHVVTTRPQFGQFSVRGSVGMATTAHGDPSADVAGVVNVPLAGHTAALRLVGYAMKDGGYIDDPADHRENINRVRTTGARLGLRTRAGDWLIDIDGAWQGIRGADSQWTDASAGPLERNGAPLGYRSDYLLGDMTLTRNWGDFALVSTTSASHQYLLEHYDATEPVARPVTARQIDRTTLFANETRLSRRIDDSTGWVIGISLLHNQSMLDRLLTDSTGSTSPHQFATNSAWEETLFGEAGIHLPFGLIATLGARLTNARSDGRATAFIEATTIPIFGSPVSGAGTQNKFRFVPTVALSGRPADGILIFARLQQGFRPGGFGISNSHAWEYRGDRVTTIEAGMRVGGGSRRFELAATLSYSDWRGILAEVVTLSGDPITENIGDGRIASLEARATWRPAARLSIDSGLFVNTSRLYHPAFASVAVADHALPNVARFGAQAAVDYRLPLAGAAELAFTANERYFGGSHVGSGPVLDAAQGDYFYSELAMTLSRGQRAISLSVCNPLDAKGNRFALGTPYRIYAPQATPLRPRTIRLGIDFGL